jgi:hypothetical protein
LLTKIRRHNRCRRLGIFGRIDGQLVDDRSLLGESVHHHIAVPSP